MTATSGSSSTMLASWRNKACQPHSQKWRCGFDKNAMTRSLNPDDKVLILLLLVGIESVFLCSIWDKRETGRLGSYCISYLHLYLNDLSGAQQPQDVEQDVVNLIKSNLSLFLDMPTSSMTPTWGIHPQLNNIHVGWTLTSVLVYNNKLTICWKTELQSPAIVRGALHVFSPLNRMLRVSMLRALLSLNLIGAHDD